MDRVVPPRGFPLGEWVDRHRTARYNLARSGMVGSLELVPRILKAPPAAEPEEVRGLLADNHGVHRSELFLTHGAHEANFLALAFLAGRARRGTGRLAVRVDSPEYPQIVDAVGAAGGRLVSGARRPDVWALSNPNNPTGRWRSPKALRMALDEATTLLVDEAYREFTEARSAAGAGLENVWTTGTFTKVYGADEIRVGWSIPPSSATADYARFHAVAADRIAERSIRSAAAILSDRADVLDEVRSKFDRNVRVLQTKVPGTEEPFGPVWFDRGQRTLPGDRIQSAALRRSVLVCSGTFFGDAGGVRICLSRKSFPEDLDRYLEVRRSFV